MVECHTLPKSTLHDDSRLVAEKVKSEQRKHQIISAEMKKIIRLPDLPQRLSALLVH